MKARQSRLILQNLITAMILAFSITPAFAQNLAQENLDTLKKQGYYGIKVAPFSQAGSNQSATGLYKLNSDKIDLLALAKVAPDKEGASLSFNVYDSCKPTVESELHKRFISISDQKIEAYYFCVKAQAGETNESIYVPKSSAARQFAEQEFLAKKYVWVTLNNITIPFDTSGFSVELKKAGGKAL